MVFRFIILSDEADDFRRDIIIDSDATFFDLHNAILDAAGYEKDQMTSFFICDDDWNKETEITLVEMDTNSDEDSYVMDSTRLSDLLEDEKQKMVYVFEYLTERSFFMELREIITGKNQKKPECIKSVGEAPPQITEFNEFSSDNLNSDSALISDDDFLFDHDNGLDEYNEDDFADLSDDTIF